MCSVHTSILRAFSEGGLGTGLDNVEDRCGQEAEDQHGLPPVPSHPGAEITQR